MHFRCRFAIIIKHRATQAVRTGQKMNMGAFPSGQWGQTVNLLLNASVVRIHQLPPKRDTYKGVSFFCFACFLRGYRWWIRTARAPRLRPAGQKCPSGAFLGRGLRIHQLPPRNMTLERKLWRLFLLPDHTLPIKSTPLCRLHDGVCFLCCL